MRHAAICFLWAVCGPALSAATWNCTNFTLPATTFAYGINNAGVVVGVSGTQGFIRDPQGNIKYVNFGGAALTSLTSINNHGVSLGAAVGGSVVHYFTLDPQGNFTPIDLPSPYFPTETAFYGINDNGAISGFYRGSGNIAATFVVLNPDGTVVPVPGYSQGAPSPSVGDINTSNQMLEILGSPGLGSFLRQTTGNNGAIAIQYLDPRSFITGSYAYGLNNLGAVVGYVSLTQSGAGPPFVGFLRTPAGVYSDLVCGGDSTFRLVPRAINDNGVIVGTGGPGVSIAIQQPGNAVFNASPASLDFGTVIPGQPAAPRSFSVTNSGDARLDIGNIQMRGSNPCCSAPDFTVSACMSQGAATSSLPPQASCSITVTPVLNPSHSALVNDLVVIDDSAAGPPHTIPVSMYVAAAAPPPLPSCRVSGSPGPPPLLTFVMQDSGSGLQSIAVSNSTNATINVPTFSPGTNNPVTVQVTQANPSLDTSVSFAVTNGAGTTAPCGSFISASPSSWTGSGGLLLSTVAAGADQDGRLETFVLGADHALWQIAQTSPNGPWGQWTSLGGSSLAGNPSVGVDADGRLEAFLVSADGGLWNVAQTSPGSWSGSVWQMIPAAVTGRPAVVRNADGRLEVFGLGLDNALHHVSQTTAGSSQWQVLDSLGGVLTSDPAAAVNADGRVEVFVVGTDTALWHIAQTAPGGSWADWASLGASLKGDPAAISDSAGSINVFARGIDDSLWAISQAGSATWSDWTALQGQMIGNPTTAIDTDGRIEVSVVGSDNALWHIWKTTQGGVTWSPWTSLGGYIVDDDVTAAKNSSGILTLFAVGGDQSLWHISQSLPGVWN